MSDYSAVAPPQTNYDPNSAFADAVQRARQIAAKIHTSSGNDSNSSAGGTKRPLEREETEENASDDTPEPKKIASLNDPFGAQLAAMQQQQRAGGPLANALTVEEWKVPDKMVGLIIGRGGEQITRLQAESGCKIQMAADSGGLPDRICTLTGNKQAIDKAKELISQIVNRGGPPLPPILDPNHLPEGHSVTEMMIPGGKVGLVIGKGGETIRNLQERAGVKMVMIQDGPQQTLHEKPLRITGEPKKCEYAKQLIMDLITEKELETIQRGAGGFMQPITNEYGTAPPGTHEIMVPRPAVGVVIGKNGDMIKRIQQDSGAKVHFQQGSNEGPGDKICVISGTPEQVQTATNFINELIHSVLSRDSQGMGRGRGRGRGFDSSRPDFGGPGMGRGRGRGEDMQECQFPVHASKCGLVIGKSGETIKEINQQSGAYVELSRLPAPSPHEKIFFIRGNPQQIEHAQQLISERVGAPPPGQNGPPAYPTQYPQPYQQPPPPPQSYAPQGWGNAYQHWQNQAAAPNDPTKAVADANAAAWAAYYAQYYGQQAQQPQHPIQPPQPQPQPPPQPQPQHDPQTAPPQQPQQPQPQPVSAAPAPTAGAQPDYSAAWAEYYRSLGLFREAEMIEQQARATQHVQAVQQAPQPYPQQPPAPTPAPAVAPPVAQPGPPAAAATAPPPQTQPQQPPCTAPQPPPPTQPTPAPGGPVPAPAPGAPPQTQPFPLPPAAPPGQWAPAGYPQQNPYGQQQQPQQQQQNPYMSYNYAPYGGQQQFTAGVAQ